MTKAEFLSGWTFTAKSTEGEFVFSPSAVKDIEGYIKHSGQKESGDVYCIVESVHDDGLTCSRYMLGVEVFFEVYFFSFTAVKPGKEASNG